MWKPDLCIYHGNCDDGFGAAYAVWKRWGDDVEFFPASYGKPPPDVTGKDVIMVDFSFKYPVMRELGNAAKSIVVLDHHKTAQTEMIEWGAGQTATALEKRLASADFDIAHCLMQNCLPIIAWFDMEKSGARLAWEFCHPSLPVPRLIEHIEDRDLWRFALPYTRHVSACVRSYKQTFDRWDAWIEADDVTSLIRDGGAILRAEQKLIAQFMEQVIFDEIGGHHVPTVNVPYHFASDTANELLSKFEYAPFAAAWFRRGDGKFQVSLRSEDSRADVSEIAKLYGGGGHRNAAGFEVPSERDWKLANRASSAGVTAPSEVDAK